jgi:hypothetical protein
MYNNNLAAITGKKILLVVDGLLIFQHVFIQDLHGQGGQAKGDFGSM